MGGEVKALSDRVDVISTDLDCIDEINKLLDQEILLALENQKTILDKMFSSWLQYVQWSNGNAELDRLRRFWTMQIEIQEMKTHVSKLTSEMMREVKDLSDRVDVISMDLDGNVELDRLRRFCISYEYVEAEQVRDNAVHVTEQLVKVFKFEAYVQCNRSRDRNL
ncbi:hypothetical protein Tco_1150167 [Tanacetum coccineum]